MFLFPSVHITMFVLNEFVGEPTIGKLDKCRKSDLFEIAEHYGIMMSTSLFKRELKAAVLEGFIAHNVLLAESPGSVVESNAVFASGSPDVPEKLSAVRSTPQMRDTVKAQVVGLAGIEVGGQEIKPVVFPHFEPVFSSLPLVHVPMHASSCGFLVCSKRSRREKSCGSFNSGGSWS